MAGKNHPSIELINQCFVYKHNSLFWRHRPREHFVNDQAWKAWNTKFAGNEAGCPYFDNRENQWRWRVGLSGKRIYRSVLVWALHYQEWPTCDVDHKDRQPLNDHIENLRLVTDSQSNANRAKPSNNQSGCKGVFWDSRRGRWTAQIGVNGKRITIGRFNTVEEAHAAYCQAAIKYFGEFACLD